MKSITQSELEAILFATNKTQFVSFVSVTDPAMRKRDNPHPKARKVSLVVGCVNWTYSKSVNKQRYREAGERAGVSPPVQPTLFRALERKWGVRVKNTPLVSHVCGDEGETRLYLEVKVERRTFFYFDSETCQPINHDSIGSFLLAAEKNERQELNKEVTLRDYRLTSIAEITIVGEQYRIAPAAAELQKYIPAPKPTRAKAPAKAPQRRTPPPAKRKRPGAT